MNLLKPLRGAHNFLKDKFQGNEFDNVHWLVSGLPTLGRVSMTWGGKLKAIFWIIHESLFFYFYGIGNLVYQISYAEGAGDFIKSYVNISILVFASNNGYWFVTKRSILKSVMEMAKTNDDICKSYKHRTRQVKYLTMIKRMIITLYVMNTFNAFTMYLPNRLKLDTEFAMVPCVGMDLTSSPNRIICRTLTVLQELAIMTLVLNYQAVLFFVIAHTAVTYYVLADEIMTIQTGDVNVSEKLQNVIKHHVLILRIIGGLKDLYSMPIGLNFATNAVCIALFFYIPLAEWVKFIPIIVYSILIFFLYCFLGQRIINGAEVFERAVYSCGWENFDLKEKKMVYVMLMIAQQKVELLAADIVPINIYTFATSCQAMFKFVTVVKL